MNKSNSSSEDSGFLLHSYPYLETSLIAEIFTRHHGRIAMVAKGAKRPKGKLYAVLQPFQPLHFSWFGRAELKTLKTAEQERIMPQLAGAALLPAFYLNELLMKLFVREEPHEVLFDAYQLAMATLSQRGISLAHVASCLRQFELTMLRELGYAITLIEEAGSHHAVIEHATYIYVLERGLVRLVSERHAAPDGLQLRGKTLLDMEAGDYSEPATQQQSKHLMRYIINHLLGNQILHTRNLIREMK